MKKLIVMKSANTGLRREQEASKNHPEEDSITPEQIAAYGKQLDAFVQVLAPGVRKTFVLWPDRELHQKSRPKITSLARSHGFTVIDLYDTFGNTAQTLSWDTVHPHPDTIRRAAEVIRRK